MLNNAATTADLFVLNIKMAVLTLVLNLDELDVRDEAENFDNVAHDLVSRDRLDKLDLVVGLEVGHLVLDLTDNFKV